MTAEKKFGRGVHPGDGQVYELDSLVFEAYGGASVRGSDNVDLGTIRLLPV